jgi:choline dehydrogenase
MFDLIVVGGGSAGCIVAGTSAERGRRVLLLEAGPSAEEHPDTLRADGYKDAFVNDAVFWERFSVPQRGAGGQRVFMGSGRVLGGSGSVNGMVYTRGAREDYAEWPSGWRWDDVVPDFVELERRLGVRPRAPTRWAEACIAAAEACGFARKDDLNDGELHDCIGYETMAYDGNERRSSYAAFLRPVRGRENLSVVTGATVERVVFDAERRVTGVAYRHEGVSKTAAVRGEVVLCAGALETPRLMMLSGVGPGEELRAAGVAVVADVAEVGANLHDHPNVPVFFRCRGTVDCHYPQLYSFYRTLAAAPLAQRQSDTCYVFWPAPSAMKEAMQRMLPAQLLPERLYQSRAKRWLRAAVGLPFKSALVRRQVEHLYAIVVILGKPQSRGTVRLASSDPRAPARIDPRYFEHPQDLETMVRGVAMARRLARAPALAEMGSAELMPGLWVERDEAVARWVQKNAITTYHFAGTCRLGTVVDTELRVTGVRGLRVADASVVPTTPVSALNAPSMLIGLRAARYLG